MLTAAFSLFVYIYLVTALVSWWCFLVPNSFLPDAVSGLKLYSMDTAPLAASNTQALSMNLATIFAFGFFHSLLARKTVKQWMGLPTAVERPLFCLQGAFFLHMMQHCWVDAVDSMVFWDYTDSPPMTNALLAVFWFGTAFVLSATFALDHFHLFGLSQGFGMDINRMVGLAAQEDTSSQQVNGTELKTRWHYNHVAHPIMTGFLINLWATPTMTAPRLGLALFLTLYIVVATTHFEEHTIREELGGIYDAYLAKTPRFFPSFSMDTSGSRVKDV